jgi:hypothetical protein
LAFEVGNRQESTRAPYRRPHPTGSIVAASQSGAAAATASRQARTDSPASSRRLRSRTAATTCVESVRALPPDCNNPLSTSFTTSRSNALASRPCSTTRVRNSESTEASNPRSVNAKPSAYFQSRRSQTASAA